MFSHQDDVSIAKAIVFKAHPFCSAIFRLSLLMRSFASTQATLNLTAQDINHILSESYKNTHNYNQKRMIIESFNLRYRKRNSSIKLM
jgi:hypothetical protein